MLFANVSYREQKKIIPEQRQNFIFKIFLHDLSLCTFHLSIFFSPTLNNLRLIKHRIQLIFYDFSLLLGTAGFVRQQVHTNVRVGQVLAVSLNWFQRPAWEAQLVQVREIIAHTVETSKTKV